jgi:hypothetical protein
VGTITVQPSEYAFAPLRQVPLTASVGEFDTQTPLDSRRVTAGLVNQ